MLELDNGKTVSAVATLTATSSLRRCDVLSGAGSERSLKRGVDKPAGVCERFGMSKIAEFRLSTKNAHGVESRCWVYCSRALTYRGGAGRRLMRIKVNPNEGVLCQLFAARTFPWLDWRSKPFRVSLSTCRPRRREYAVLSWDGGIHALVTRDRRRVSPSFEDAPWVLLHGLWELLEECGLRPDEVVYLTARHCR